MINKIIFVAGFLGLSALQVAYADNGKSIHDSACAMCHGSGMAGAPKTGDKSAWQERIAKGVAELEKNAIVGMQGYSGFMPPKGGNPKLSDSDVKAAVAYMITASK